MWAAGSSHTAQATVHGQTHLDEGVRLQASKVATTNVNVVRQPSTTAAGNSPPAVRQTTPATTADRSVGLGHITSQFCGTGESSPRPMFYSRRILDKG